jgi:hypothetical protein
VFASNRFAIPVFLSLAARDTGRMALVPRNVLDDARKQWSAAFSRCYVYTMRSLAFPANYGRSDTKLGDSSHAFRSPESIFTVLSSDRPLPKSPSVQRLEDDLGVTELEREERNWWAARFQRVLTELSSREDFEAVPKPRSDDKDRINHWEAFADTIPTRRSLTSRPIAIIKESKTKLLKLKR